MTKPRSSKPGKREPSYHFTGKELRALPESFRARRFPRKLNQRQQHGLGVLLDFVKTDLLLAEAARKAMDARKRLHFVLGLNPDDPRVPRPGCFTIDDMEALARRWVELSFPRKAKR